MKKIMFNDKYGLTQAVLEGRKTQTRRIAHLPEGATVLRPDLVKLSTGELRLPFIFGNYRRNEEVAVAQKYSELKYGVDWVRRSINREHAGWNNKMFVSAEEMPHRIKITNIRVEMLQDISEEDCLKEGFEEICVNDGLGNMLSHWEYLLTYDDKLGRSLQLGSRYHKEAFETLIDKTCGVGTWESNPYVFVYDFELIR